MMSAGSSSVMRHVCRHHSRLIGSGRRVVVTGMGIVSCLGIGVNHVWQELIEGQCGLSNLTAPEYEQIPCRVAGVVPRGTAVGQLDLDEHIPSPSQRSMSLATCYALVAAAEAIRQSGWEPETHREQCRTGVAVGMGMGGMEEIAEAGQLLQHQGYRRVSPHFIPRILVNMAAGQISLHHGYKGVNHAVSTACTTGLHAIGDASRFIQHGDVDVMVCGGTEASINAIGIAGFSRMRALCTSFNDNPSKASRPFDHDRDGFVMAEGAGVLVLEELNHARERGATILGEVLGYGLSADANHITAPSKDGDGALRCMEAAIHDAGIRTDNVGYVNAHATSTPLGDAAECKAITKLFGDRTPAVSSTKGAVGHLLGAAGAVEAIFTLMACRTAVLPPTLNCHKPDSEFNINFVPLRCQEWPQTESRIALTNSFGFGGTNASLCLGQFTD